MKKLLFIGLLILGLFLISCDDEGNAEISVIVKQNGRSHSASVECWNMKGVQIKEIYTSSDGIGYLKDIPAGTYILKFRDHEDNYYSTVKKVSVSDGGTQPVKVELSDPPDEGTVEEE